MNPIIVIATHKGGEGKTTFSSNIAEYYALVKNKKVLLVDCDQQANLSSRYLNISIDSTFPEGKIPSIHPDYDNDEDWDGISSITDIFFNRDVCPYPTRIKNLEIIPSHSQKLQEIEKIEDKYVNQKVFKTFRDFLRLPSLHNEYDLIIIDTPPAKGNITRAAISAATHLLIPAKMEKYSMEGIYGMLQLWKKQNFNRGKDDKLELIGFVPNMCRNVNLHNTFHEMLKKSNQSSEHVLDVMIKQRTIYAEVVANESDPLGVFELKKGNQAREEFSKLCEIIDKKVFGVKQKEVST